MEQPDEILFIDDVAQRLRMSVRTIKRRLRTRAFPIPELPRLDHRRRWSRITVENWIATARQQPIRIVSKGRSA